MDPSPIDCQRMQQSDAPLDRALLTRLQSGDRAAFHTVVRPVLGSLLGLARRLTGDAHGAEDLVQETLIQGYRAIHTFRGDASPRTWLLRIETRLALRPTRWKRGARPEGSVSLDEPIPDRWAQDPSHDSRERELAERLDEAMERLTTRQRTALHLRAIEGLDYEHIASVLGGTRVAARMLVLAARKHVMERMGRHLEP